MNALISRKHRRVVVPQLPELEPLREMDNEVLLKGEKHFALRDTADTFRVLSNAGIEIENPVRRYYNWPIQPGRSPYKSQVDAVDLMTANRRAYVLSDMGAGKTLSSLWAFDWLRQQKAVKSALICAPLSTLLSVWDTEVFTVFPHLSTLTLHGRKKHTDVKKRADLYLINHDGLRVMFREIMQNPWIDCVIIDELSVFKERRTEKWKALNSVLKSGRIKYAWGLTGTPTPNAPTDAYAQCKLLTPHTVPMSYGRFEDHTMVKITQFKRKPKRGANEFVKQVMAPAIRVKRTDIVELPDTSYHYYPVLMGPQQRKAYDQMKRDLYIEMEEGEIKASNEGVKLAKLLQIGYGFAYDKTGVARHIPGSTRVPAVADLADQCADKAIIFCGFNEAIGMIEKELRKRGHPVETVHGGTPRAERDRIFTEFQMRNGKRTKIIAHPRTMSHGLTLTEADTIIWAGAYPGLETFLQANARIIRPGQKRKTSVFMLVGSLAENKVYRALKQQDTMQGLLLTILEGT